MMGRPRYPFMTSAKANEINLPDNDVILYPGETFLFKWLDATPKRNQVSIKVDDEPVGLDFFYFSRRSGNESGVTVV